MALDWLTVTIPYPSDMKSLLRRLEKTGGKQAECKPAKPYINAVTCEFFSVHWHEDYPEFRVMLRFDGGNCALWREKKGADRELLNWVAGMDGKVSRLDYAVDLLDTDARPTDILLAWECSQVLTTAQAVNSITGRRRLASGEIDTTGDTVYIGTRQSERFLRIYDKAKQTQTDREWTRIELETKGERARQMARDMLINGVNEAGVGAIRSVVEWTDVDWFEQALELENLVLQSALPETETDRERWIREVVLPAIAAEIETGNERVIKAVTGMLDKYHSGGAHGRRPS